MSDFRYGRVGIYYKWPKDIVVTYTHARCSPDGKAYQWSGCWEGKVVVVGLSVAVT